MDNPTCSKCSTDYVKRVHRQWIWDRFLSLFDIYPFRCQLCGRRFRVRQPGVRYKKMEEDWREYERMPVSFPIRVAGDEALASGQTLDLSMAGCTFDTAARLTQGHIVRIELRVADDQPPIAVDAALVKTVRPKRVGVEFLRLQPAEKERLQKLVRSLLPLRSE